MKTILILLCFCCSSLCGIAQKSLQLKSRTKIPASTKNIVDAYVTDNDELLRVFRQDLGMKKIESGSHRGAEYNDIQFGLILPSGIELPLKSNQSIRSIRDNKVLAAGWDHENNSNSIKLFEIKDRELSVIAYFEIGSQEISVKHVGNKNIIVDDASEGYGTYLNVYNSELQMLNCYKPFEQGYQIYYVDAFDNILVAVFKNSENQLKAAIFNCITGKVVNEGILNTKTDLQSLIVTKNEFIIYGDTKLSCFDFSGNILWQKENYRSANLDFVSSKSDLYFFSDKQLTAIDSKSGSIKWRRNLYELMGQSPDEKKLAVRPISSSKVENGGIGLILSYTPNGTLRPNLAKRNSRFFQFDKHGVKTSEIILPTESAFLNFKNTLSKVNFFTDTEILKYEN